jgi:hypothetical protein
VRKTPRADSHGRAGAKISRGRAREKGAKICVPSSLASMHALRVDARCSGACASSSSVTMLPAAARRAARPAAAAYTSTAAALRRLRVVAAAAADGSDAPEEAPRQRTGDAGALQPPPPAPPLSKASMAPSFGSNWRPNATPAAAAKQRSYSTAEDPFAVAEEVCACAAPLNSAPSARPLATTLTVADADTAARARSLPLRRRLLLRLLLRLLRRRRDRCAAEAAASRRRRRHRAPKAARAATQRPRQCRRRDKRFCSSTAASRARQGRRRPKNCQTMCVAAVARTCARLRLSQAPPNSLLLVHCGRAPSLSNTRCLRCASASRTPARNGPT